MNKNLLITINNIKLAYKYKKLVVLVPNTKSSFKLISLLASEGYVRSYKIINNKNILIYLANKNYKLLNNIINTIKIISKPSRKIYKPYKNLAKFNQYKNLNNLMILSTNLGFLSKEKALELKQGGQLLFTIN